MDAEEDEDEDCDDVAGSVDEEATSGASVVGGAFEASLSFESFPTVHKR